MLKVFYYVVALVLTFCFCYCFDKTTDKNVDRDLRSNFRLLGIVFFIMYLAFVLNFGRIFSIWQRKNSVLYFKSFSARDKNFSKVSRFVRLSYSHSFRESRRHCSHTSLEECPSGLRWKSWKLLNSNVPWVQILPLPLYQVCSSSGRVPA